MVAYMLPDELQRGAGCSDVCQVIHVIRPGLRGRQPLLLHDPEVHESYGIFLAGGNALFEPIETGLLTIDERFLSAAVAGRELQLSPTEWKILLHLARRLGRFSMYGEILQEIWGPHALEGREDHRVITVNLGRMRAKLGPRAAGLIETRLTVGLRLRDWPVGKDAPLVLPGRPRTVGL